MGTYWTELILEAVWYELMSHMLCAYYEKCNARFCSTLDYLWFFFRANRFQKAWTWMCSATGQSRAAGQLTSRYQCCFHAWLGNICGLNPILFAAIGKCCVLLLNRHGSYWFLLCARRNICWGVVGTAWNGSRKSLVRQRRKLIKSSERKRT